MPRTAAADRAGGDRFANTQRGYLAGMTGSVPRRLVTFWQGIVTSPVLGLNGWVAFNLPRTVTALGAALLLGLVAVHVYEFATEPRLPRYFVVYAAVLTAGCLIATVAMVVGLKPVVPQIGW